MTAGLVSLTAEQAAAVTTKSRDVVVEACAGAGKTRVMVARIVHLLDQGYDPAGIICFTFTRSAAEEIRSRLGDRSAGVTVTTFHAYAAGRIIGDGSAARIATEAETQASIESIYEGRMRRSARNRIGRRQLDAAIHRMESGSAPITADEHQTIECVRERLRRAGAPERRVLVPMWDLIPTLLRSDRIPLGHHVLVDEAHDITQNELDVVRNLAHGGSKYFVLDPCQAIFRWRGGGATFGLPADRFRLTQSFRFGAAIARVANAIQPGAGVVGDDGRASIVWYPDSDEFWGTLLIEDLERDPSRVLVLARDNRQCRLIAERCGGRAHHVTRDDHGDPFAAEADRFGDVWRSGRAVISTIHAAKGREADVVFVAPSETFPSRRDPEEMRIAYVAVTRARERLVLGELAGSIRLDLKALCGIVERASS